MSYVNGHFSQERIPAFISFSAAHGELRLQGLVVLQTPSVGTSLILHPDEELRQVVLGIT